MTPAIPQLMEFHLLMEQILYLQTTESESPVTDKQEPNVQCRTARTIDKIKLKK